MNITMQRVLSFYLPIYFFPCLLSAQLLAMEPSTPTAQISLVLESKILSKKELYLPLNERFKDQPLKQILALSQQQDKFSCGYRVFFHARCIDIALERLKNNTALSESLSELLTNGGMLKDCYARVKSYLDEHRAGFDQRIGIDMCHIPGICYEKINKLRGRILPVLLEEENRIVVLHDPRAPSSNPLLYTPEFIQKCGSAIMPFADCIRDIDGSVELEYQLKIMRDPHSVAHFACRFPKHVFLASMISDDNKKVELDIIDSNNNTIHESKPIQLLVNKLLEYVNALNNSNKKQKT